MEVKRTRKIDYLPMGEQILIVQFEDVLSIENNQMVQHFAQLTRTLKIEGVKDIVTAMSNFSIMYDPLLISFEQLKEKLAQIELTEIHGTKKKSRVVHIPVVFDEQHGPDLAELAKITGYSVQEIIKMITSKTYYVYMLGFIAGLPYMGDIDERIIVPRKSNPTAKVIESSFCGSFFSSLFYKVKPLSLYPLSNWFCSSNC
ncbi:allophanate hydrolase subunit 1 [Niallia sp. RD1]|uniref:5-oxoprolinase subunit B family protein n=1 Tax=Niallia sp. RD1 TaxID=2962858 RepID=UPI0020C1B1A4|nr:carboxyltransferase domain-containing protein [Niallia sp. RD1]UTI44215.1 carboxyltransferase domain-containing protein [Niallia sp. RD1]